MNFAVHSSNASSMQLARRFSAAFAVLILTWSIPADALEYCSVISFVPGAVGTEAAGTDCINEPPIPPPTTPPGTPSSITAPASVTHATAGAWTVSWGVSSGSYVGRKYELWESALGGSWARVYNGTGVSHSIAGKTLAGTYSYRARACNAVGCSGYTATKNVSLTIGVATTLSLPATNTSGSYTATWTPHASGMGAFTLEEKIGSGAWSGVHDAYSTTTKLFSNKGTATYSYRLRWQWTFCYYGCTVIDQPELPKTIVVTRPPAAVATPALTNKSGNTDTTFTISWNASSGATSYRLYRRQAAYGGTYGSWSSVYSGSGRSLNQSLGDGHYQYRVRACNASCSSYSGIRTVTVLKVPGVSATPTVSNKTNNADTSFTVSWGAASGRVTRYELYRRQATYGSSSYGSWSRVHNAIGRTLNQTLANNHYKYYARACNESGCGGNSAVITTTVLTLPGAPGVPAISNKSSDADTVFTLSWAAGSGINDTYQLRRRQAAYGSSTYGGWTTVQNSSGRSFGDTRPDNGHYQYRVRGHNASGYSPYSGIRTATVLNVSGAPGAISMSGTSNGSRDADGAYTVNWGAAGGVVDRYELRRRQAAYTNGTPAWGAWAVVQNTSSRSLTESGKTDGHYQYRARACNGSGCSAYTANKQQDVLHIPAAPTAISGPAESDGRFVLSVSYGSGFITSYKLQHAVNGSSTWVDKETGSGQPASISLTRPAYDANNLPQENYRFRIAACNVSGCSSYSASSNNIHINPPGTPASISLTGVSHQTADADGGFRVQWSAVSSPDVNYTVEERAGSGAWTEIVSGRTALYLDVQRTQQNDYQYRVKACLAGVGCGDTTNTVSVKVAFVPDVPATPTITSTHSVPNSSVDGAFTLHWLTAGGTVSHYRIHKNNAVVLSNVTGNSRAFANQADGNDTYQLEACNDVVCSGASSGRVVQLLRTPTVPGAIQGPANSNGDGSFTLTWAASSGAVARYEIQRGQGAWSDNGLSRTLNESNLADGSYSYRARACNALSCSAATSTKTVGVYLAPGAPGYLSGPPSSQTGEYSLSWGTATGTVTRYVLEEQDDGVSWSLVQDSPATTAAFSDQANNIYRYRVTACNGPNCGPYSSVHDVEVARAEPIEANPLDSVTAYAVLSGDTGVGATGASHEVGVDGSASFSIPIPVAEGRGGLTPQLSLAYSSTGGNSELGVGWDIAGVSRIYRCGTNYTLDGRVDGINFDANDKLCMDGQRLVAVSGNYGVSGTQYETLRDSQSDIRSMGIEGSLDSADSAVATEAFRVRTRDGRTLYFGGTPDSRLSRVTVTHACSSYGNLSLWGGAYCASLNTTTRSQTYQWLINRVEDRQGNSINFNYENDDSSGEQRLSDVTYNDGLHRIAFTWQARPDVTEAYFAGALLKQLRRLEKVTSYSDVTALRSLHIGYETTGSTGRSKINQITECASDTLGVDCLAPTTFAWQVGDAGYTRNTSNISQYNYSENRVPMALDINGDGFSDILSNAESTWRVALGGTETLTDWHVMSTTVTDDDRNYALSLRYNNDVRDDVLIRRGGYWQVLLANPDATGFLPAQGTGIPSTGYDKQPKIMDINGDGRNDLVFRGSNGNWHYRLLTNTGFGGAVDTGRRTHSDESRANTLIMDYNGDGLQDLLVPHSSYYKVYQSTGSGFREVFAALSATDYKREPRLLDLNGDGLTDILFRTSSNQVVYVLNKGGQFSARTTVAGVSATADQWKRAQVLDYNGDGRSEMWINGQFVRCDDQGMGSQAVIVSSAAAYISGAIPSNRHAVVLDYNGDSLDDIVVLGAGTGTVYRYTHNGERPDYLTAATNGMGVETRFTYRGLHDGSDLLENADDDFYFKEGESQYPLLAESSTAYVVSEVSQNNGIGGLQSTGYQYRGLRSHMAGLGSLGFARMITLNNQTGIRTEVSFSHNHAEHRQGAVTQVETIANNGTILSLTTNDWRTVWTNSGATGVAGQRHRIELVQNSVTKRDLNGAFLQRDVTDFTYDSYGNPDTQTSNMYSAATGGSLLSTSVTDNAWHNDPAQWLIGLLSRAELTITDHSRAAPPLRRVSSFDFDSTSGTNRGEQIRDPLTDIVLHETRFGEDINGQLQQDGFGNLLATTTKGPDFAARSQSVAFDSAYGLYPIESRDAQGNVTRHEYYGANEFGAGAYPGKVRITTAPNGLQRQFRYDRFGRVSEVTNAYGTGASVTSYTRYQWCSSNCRNGAAYVLTKHSDGGSPVRSEIDVLGRTIRTTTLAIDGREVYVDSDFDQMGHNTRVSEPYFAGNTALWNQIRYDALGRAIETTEPNGRVDTVTHDGLTTTSRIDVFGKNQSKVEVRDSLGNLVSVADNNNQTITYGYDSLARQTSVTDPAGNQITLAYNVLDQKTAMSDPDKGNWSYTHNGLGQGITQTDAKGQTVCTAYDTLGRPVKRIDNYTGARPGTVGQNAAANQQCAGAGSATTIWSYNTSGSGIGQLASVTSPDYSEVNSYDALGRPSGTVTTINGQSFAVSTSYDAFSRPDVVTYPASTGNHDRLQVRPSYNALGFHTGSYSADGTVLYSRPEAVDARGNVTISYLGNNIRTDREFDPATGYLDRIYSEQTGLVGLIEALEGNPPIQDMGVQFDAVGNLVHRSDYGSGFTENYDYDPLNRLTDAWSDYGNGNVQHTTVSYDALGNITYKSGVGQYTYGAQETGCGRIAGPHAVTRITPTGAGDSKNASYCYDANGNMTDGDGRILSYTSFDKPAYIEKGSHSTAMSYGAARQLVHRYDVDTDSGTETESFLLGGMYERVITHAGADTGRVEERHYVADAIVTYRHDSAGNEQRTPTDERRYYTHADHLGSVVAITNEIGQVVERLSFDAWGKRRAVMQPTLDELLVIDPFNFNVDGYQLKSQFTDRGFSGHQQLDGVGIVHMGGRIYDAEIGRFLQADPFVQDQTNLQGLNRYSYVENNPLSYTDPSGYFLKKLFKKIGKFISGVFRAIGQALKGLFRAIARVKWLSTVISVALNFVPGCQAWCSAAFNAGIAEANGASFGDILTGAVIGAVTSQLGNFIGKDLGRAVGVEVTKAAVKTSIKAFAVASAGQAIAAGIAAKVQGRKFIDGVKNSALVSTLTAGFKWVRGDFAPGQVEGGGAKTASAPASRKRSVTGTTLNIIGKIWNLPNTVLGLAYGFTGHVIGEIGNWFGLGAEPEMGFDHNALEFRNNPFARLGAITLGNTITYGGNPGDIAADGNVFWQHEIQHTYQGQLLGPLYLLSNGLGGTLSWISGGGWHGPLNWNEAGPQQHPPQPWP